MPRPDISPVLADFRDEIRRCNLLLAAAHGGGVRFFQLEQISELSFLRIYVAWEEFLEESFARFLCGAKTQSGFQPRRYASPKNLDHAKALVTGLERGGRFADWSKRETVLDRAQLLFKDGRPYAGPLRAAARELDDMRTIRDRIAHRSALVRANFLKLVERRLGLAYHFPPGRFLLRNAAGGAQSHLALFSDAIILLAEQIVA
jgi:hypothetical protein